MRCPICNKPVKVLGEGEPMGAFPFCSDRCRLVDLGRWLDGKYQIPVVDDDDAEDSGPVPPTPDGNGNGAPSRSPLDI